MNVHLEVLIWCSILNARGYPGDSDLRSGVYLVVDILAGMDWGASSNHYEPLLNWFECHLA